MLYAVLHQAYCGKVSIITVRPQRPQQTIVFDAEPYPRAMVSYTALYIVFILIMTFLVVRGNASHFALRLCSAGKNEDSQT